MLSVLLILSILQTLPFPPRVVAAQERCLVDEEPNDTPGNAMPIEGAVCIEGEFAAEDQDIFAWTVTTADAAKPWRFVLTGLPGQQTGLDVYRQPEVPGTPLDPSARLLRFNAEPNATAVTTTQDVLFPPGTYVLGLSKSGGEGPYRLDIMPGDPLPAAGDEEPNDSSDTATPVDAAFALSGDLAGSEDWYAWTLTEADAAQSWRLEIQVPITTTPLFTLLTPDARQVTRPFGPDGHVALDDLALAPGTYHIRLSASAEARLPYAIGAAATGSQAAGAETEPNDDLSVAQPVDPSVPLNGRLSAGDRMDFYRFTVDEALSRMQFDVKLFWQQGPERRLCLLDETGNTELKCEAGDRAAGLIDLVLPVGEYILRLDGDSVPDNPYLLRFDVTTEAAAEFEAEPNDTLALAAPLADGDTIRGRLTGADTDFFRFTVEGEPELWQVEATGPGVAGIAYYSGAGERLVERGTDPTGNATLVDLFLVPGEHWLSVVGDGGEYTLKATATGPPDPLDEIEPNDDVTRSHPLIFGETRTGRLPQAQDQDVFRFSLATEQPVALRLVPPDDARTRMRLEWSNGGITVGDIEGAVGEQLLYEPLLPAGDYAVYLSPIAPSAERYEVSLEFRDPFDLPEDLEPNDTRAQARPLPASLQVEGTLSDRNNYDWYTLPPADTATTVTITSESQVTFTLYDGDLQLPMTPDATGTKWSTEIPPTPTLALEVYGYGIDDYAFTVSFAEGPESESTPIDLPVGMEFKTETEEVAAYLTEGQSFDGGITLSNQDSTSRALTLDATTSDSTWSLDFDQTEVELPASGQVTVPVTVRIAPDASARQLVQLTVRARDADGGSVTETTVLQAGRDAAPVNPERVWPLPEEVLGGLDVAWSSLGAEPLPSSDGQLPEALLQLFDGFDYAGHGFTTPASLLPVTLTVDLAGEEAVPVAGVMLDPRGSSGLVQEQPLGFNVLLSDDGQNFTEVFSGELSTRAGEQFFAFEQPVPARFAQLRLNSNRGGNNLILGSWKVIAQPGTVPDGLVAESSGFNLADPELGGHILAMKPPYEDPMDAARMLDEQEDPRPLNIGPDTSVEWHIGFKDSRAAQITEMHWVDPPNSNPETRFDTVELAVSTESPVGPWTPLGTWQLERDGTGAVAPFELANPTWARYVRFQVTASNLAEIATAGFIWESPTTIRVIERATDDEYRSILGEWGRDSRAAVFELMVTPPSLEGAPEAEPNDEQATAQPLSLGEPVVGSAHIGKDVDWYRVAIPADQNTLTLTFTGLPSVDVAVTLVDEDGEETPLAAGEGAGQEATFASPVEPGQSYFVRVEQPPHSVVIAFDTSMSLASYDPFIYAGLSSFATDVEPGREAVNYLPFGEDFLLDDWGDEPYLLQSAVNTYPRTALDSASGEALIQASEEMAGRPGVRSVILITDAETSAEADQPELWALLDSVRPRIYAVHIGGGGVDLARQRHLMQDWATINAGDYRYVWNQAEMDVAFDRAATQLRRPTRYAVVAEASSEASATPTPLPTSTPESTPTPEPTPTAAPTPTVAATPTPAARGTIRVEAAALEPGVETPVATTGGAVELILDTSGSMLQPLGDQLRIDVAKSALTEVVTSTVPSGTPLALRVFGSEPDSCETNLAIPLQPLDPTTASEQIAAIQAVNLVKTPIGASLERVAEDLAGVDGPKVVVLVTDGEETCGGDPAAAIQALRDAGIDVRVNIVGFAVDDTALEAQFVEWARIGGGIYVEADTPDDLGPAIATALAPPFRVLAADGTVVAEGIVGGDLVEVPAGTYTVEVLSDPAQTFEAIAVAPEQETTLTLGSSTAAAPTPAGTAMGDATAVPPDPANDSTTASLLLTVVDPELKPLGGSCFTLTGASEIGPVCDNETGDADPTEGTILITGLSPGDYTLHEPTPPPGYQPFGDLPVTLASGQQAGPILLHVPL